MQWEFSAEVWYWRGPSPYYFVSVPDDVGADLRAAAPLVSYGWGVIPVAARLGRTEWTTSLFPKDGGYAVPLKDRVRRAESVEDGDTVTLALSIQERQWRADGSLRTDVAPEDVCAALVGVVLAAGTPEQRQQADRILDLVTDGLRPHAVS